MSKKLTILKWVVLGCLALLLLVGLIALIVHLHRSTKQPQPQPQPKPKPQCKNKGENCNTHQDCCVGTCGTDGTCGSPPSPDCGKKGAECAGNDGDCCTGLVCDSTNTCTTPPNPPTPNCKPIGKSCTTTTDCCTGLTCTDGNCTGTGPKPNWPDTLPRYWNWVEYGFTSPIKSQCNGSCVKNSQIGRIESRWFLSKGNGDGKIIPDIQTFLKQNIQSDGTTTGNYAAAYLKLMKGLYPTINWDARYGARTKDMVGMLPTFSYASYGRCKPLHSKNSVVDEYSSNGVYFDFDERNHPNGDYDVNTYNKIWPFNGSCDLGFTGASKCIVSSDPASCVQNIVKNGPLPQNCNSKCSRAIKSSGSLCAGVGKKGFSQSEDWCKKYHEPVNFSTLNCDYMKAKLTPYISASTFKSWAKKLPYQSAKSLNISTMAGITNFANLIKNTGVRGCNVNGMFVNHQNADKDGNIIPKKKCDSHDNHQIECVGWNTTDTTDPNNWYWIVRNSWGTERAGEGLVFIKMIFTCPQGLTPSGLTPIHGAF